MANKITNFIKEVKVELGKVTWSTKNELIASTVVVIVSVLILSVFIGICDFVILRAINFILRA
ncbi:MAG: preprotein translocase subunit SecE [Candidatus Omnitrophica bacterium]|nr:preprotein translocase subunit SecE [Candidatus Omnitrophota bacterium]